MGTRIACLLFCLEVAASTVRALGAEDFPYPVTNAITKPDGSVSYAYSEGTMIVSPQDVDISPIVFPLFSLKRMKCDRIARTLVVMPRSKTQWLWIRCANNDASVYTYHV